MNARIAHRRACAACLARPSRTWSAPGSVAGEAARYDARMRARTLLLIALLGAGVTGPRALARAGRAPGAVVGVLRHKGCPSAPSGASVSVIGRDATAVADAAGRFSLTLPAGTYSLVIGGPGLVQDQRVDDVSVASGQTRDLGTVEVWPEERPPGCAPAMFPAPASSAVVATAPDTPALDLPGAGAAPSAASADQIWVRGTAGVRPGQFGLQGDPARDEEDALGPPSFAVGPQGSLWAFDALNGRVQRFDARGHAVSSFPVARRGETAVEADIAVTDDAHVLLFAEGDPATFSVHDAGGRLLVSAAMPPSFKGVDLLFAGRLRPLFLMQNGQAVRAEVSWAGVKSEGPLPGLPVGGLFVTAERADRWRAVLTFAAADRRVRRSVQLHSRVPISGVRIVGVDRRGDIVLAIDRAEALEEGTPRAEVLLLSVDQLGHLSGAARAPPGGPRFEFREFALAPDGTVVQMQSDAAEVRFVRWTLRPLPREALAGKGMVRGRIVEPCRAAPGARPTAAAVSVGRSHRRVAVAPDGSFEVLLPSGTWVLSVRCGPAAAPASSALEQPLEIRVAVAAGATVDVGNVHPPRPPAHVPPNPLERSAPGGAP